MKLSERLEASLVSMSHLCSVDMQTWNVHSNDVLEAKRLLEECERALQRIGQHIIDDNEQEVLLVVDATLTRLRAQERG